MDGNLMPTFSSKPPFLFMWIFPYSHLSAPTTQWLASFSTSNPTEQSRSHRALYELMSEVTGSHPRYSLSVTQNSSDSMWEENIQGYEYQEVFSTILLHCVVGCLQESY